MSGVAVYVKLTSKDTYRLEWSSISAQDQEGAPDPGNPQPYTIMWWATAFVAWGSNRTENGCKVYTYILWPSENGWLSARFPFLVSSLINGTWSKDPHIELCCQATRAQWSCCVEWVRLVSKLKLQKRKERALSNWHIMITQFTVKVNLSAFFPFFFLLLKHLCLFCLFFLFFVSLFLFCFCLFGLPNYMCKTYGVKIFYEQFLNSNILIYY